MTIPTTILAAGPLVSALGAVLGPVLCGLAFAVLSMGSFNGVSEDLNNPKPNPGHAISRGYSHLLMCSIVFATLLVVSPLLGGFAPFIPGLYMGFAAITLLSALCNGGYAHLHETWPKSKVKAFHNIIWGVDKFLSFIPASVRSILGNALSKLHPWLAKFYITAQVGLFIGITIGISPSLGIAGLSYFGLEFARAQNKLPIAIGVILEKFRSVMEIISGFFTNNNLLHLYAFYKLSSAVTLSMASYKNGVKNTETAQPAIISTAEKITAEKIIELQQKVPVSTLFTELHKDGIEKDVNTIFSNYDKYYAAYKQSVIQQRKNDYAEFEKLATSPSKLDRAKYYVGYIPMNLKTYLPINSYYNPAMFNKFSQDYAATKPIGVTTNHMEHGQVVMPAPKDVDFSGFVTLAKNQVALNKERIEAVKPILENLVNFTALKTKKAAEMVAESEAKGLDLEQINEQIEDLKYDIKSLERLNKFQQDNNELFDKLLAELCNKEKTVGSLKNKDPRRPNRDQYNQIYNILYAAENSEVLDIDTARVKVANAVSMVATGALSQQIDELEQQRGTKLNTKFYLDFFESRIQIFCDKVKNGNVAWDKSVTSVELWQSKSKHLINYITELLESNDEQQIALAFAVLSSLVEATDECAESVFNAVEKFYYNLVKPKFILDELEQGKINTKDLVHINMTHIRNKVFDKMYGMLPTNDNIKSWLFFLEFGDKHDQSYIRRATQPVLHLSSDDGLTSGDLSRKNVDVLKEMGSQAISWLSYRLLLICEQEGYSADGIVMEMWEQFKNYDKEPHSMQDVVCPVAFNAYSCLRRWANDIQSPSVKDHVNSILDAAITIELDTSKLITQLSESKDSVGDYIRSKINGGMSTDDFLKDLNSPEEDDDNAQQYIIKMIRNANIFSVDSLNATIYGLSHCQYENVRKYIAKRIKSESDDDGAYNIDLNEFLAELKEFRSNKQIRELIRQKINVKNAMELQIKSLMTLMLIDTDVLKINAPELKASFEKILECEAVTSEIVYDSEPEVVDLLERSPTSELRAFSSARRMTSSPLATVPELTPVSTSVTPVSEDSYESENSSPRKALVNSHV